ncbi:hypothetical protein ADIS_0775 [Lunatimonas lonarensis]|uniref:Uncharacterized protein n=1 Tax=Lunatimonas lonarensis TaxID=1232681 RepID=R7ZXY5_9BACT|nr:hypothetical protein ADIS_0775 [Lunatimonas lonarensis]
MMVSIYAKLTDDVKEYHTVRAIISIRLILCSEVFIRSFMGYWVKC